MSSPLNLSASETALLVAMVTHCRTKIDTDWNRVAAEVGLKSGVVAQKRYYQFTVKHDINGRKQKADGDKAGPADSDSAFAATPTPKKKRKSSASERTPGDEGSPRPTKMPRKPRKSSPAMDEEPLSSPVKFDVIKTEPSQGLDGEDEWV